MYGYVLSINMIGGMKMKIIKKTAFLAVSAAMLMQFTALTPIPVVSAAATETVIDGLTYVYVPDSPSKNECTIQLIYDDANKHISKHDTVNVPEKIGNYTVAAIGDEKGGFIVSKKSDAVHVETIKLPNTIKAIHKHSLIDSDLPCLATLFVNIDGLEEVGVDAFGLYTRLTEVYAYDKIDKAYYATSNDLNKFKELIGIEGIRFQNLEGSDDCFMLSKEDYSKNKCANGRLEFVNEVACSPYTRKIGYLYAEEAVNKLGIKNDKRLNNLQKMEKIANFISTNTMYSALYTYNADSTKCRRMDNLTGSAMSVIGFHSGVCGGFAHAFEDLCRAAIGHDIVDKNQDIICIGVPGHALNGVRLEHSDGNEGYYVVDNTAHVFMQGVGKGVGEYGDKDSDFSYTGYIYGVNGSIAESDATNHDVYIAKDPDLYYKGISYVYLRDETKDALHITMGDKNDKNNNFIDFDSYPINSSSFYLDQIPRTKCGNGQAGEGLNFYVEPNMYYSFTISNSKDKFVFSGDGEHKFKLGDAEYVCTVTTRDYNTPTEYNTVIPHTAYKNYFEVVVKQLTDDPKPDIFTTTTIVHKTGTTAPVTTTTTTTAKPTTTTAKPTTTTAKPTTTTAKPTTTTKPATTTTAKKETPNLIPPTGKEIEFTGSLQELINAGKASGGTLQYKIGEDGTWSEKIPTASEVGDYTVYYRVVGNEKYYGADTNADITGRKNYSFPYCYNCSRSPAFPVKNEDCEIYKISSPLIGFEEWGTTAKGKWTLEYISAYKDFDVNLSNKPGLVKDIANKLKSSYELSTADDISIYELKDNGKHIAYGIIYTASTEDSEVLFIGDTWSGGAGGAGYALSNNEITDSKILKTAKDLSDISKEKIALSGKINSKIFKNADVAYGDANCDGSVNMADAVLIMQSIANPSKYGVSGTDKAHITAQGQKNGDVSGNGDGITNKDALAIQKYKLALINKLPE